MKHYYGIDSYFFKEDEDAIRLWYDEEAEDVFLNMDAYGLQNVFKEIFSSTQCPFCILHQSECEHCEYAVIHGQCDDINSDYKSTVKLLFNYATGSLKEIINNVLAQEIKGFAHYNGE